MDFGKKKFPVDVKVLNTGDVVHSMEELMPVSYTHLYEGCYGFTYTFTHDSYRYTARRDDNGCLLYTSRCV